MTMMMVRLFPQGLGADSLFEDPDFPADRYYVLLRRYRLSEERAMLLMESEEQKCHN